jgi:hypothetical protein
MQKVWYPTSVPEPAPFGVHQRPQKLATSFIGIVEASVMAVTGLQELTRTKRAFCISRRPFVSVKWA